MKRLEKEILRKQVDVYLNWRQKNGCDQLYPDWLTLFVNTCARVDIYDVTPADLQIFLDKSYEVAPTRHEQKVARKAVEGLIRFYGARNKNGKGRETRGRPPHLSEIEKVKNYRKMGLKFREIERLTGKKVSLIHKWINYTVKE